MADRVRCKSKNAFDNPFIYNHHEDRLGRTSVQEDDEFSTEPDHADQLVIAGMAEKIGGDASERTERHERLIGAQTPAGTPAVVTNRQLKPDAAANKPKG